MTSLGIRYSFPRHPKQSLDTRVLQIRQIFTELQAFEVQAYAKAETRDPSMEVIVNSAWGSVFASHLL